jgi:hypothetical protein
VPAPAARPRVAVIFRGLMLVLLLVPAERIAEVARELQRRGLVGGEAQSRALTAVGHEHAQRLVEARRELLRDALADESAHRNPEVTAPLVRLARELCGEPPTAPAPARAAA